MAESYFPLPNPAQMGPAEWQSMMLAVQRDRLTTGLGVTVVAGLTVRAAAGDAMCGGFSYNNSANKDTSTTGNTAAYPRYDRLVLRTTITGTGVLAGVTVAQVLKKGTASPTPDSYPAVTQVRGGVWEIPLARWWVGAGSSLISGLVCDAPGSCIGGWGLNGQDVASSGSALNVPWNGHKFAAASVGPQPVAFNAEGRPVAIHDGVHHVNFKSYMPGGGAISAARIAIDGPWMFFPSYSLYGPDDKADVTATGYCQAGDIITTNVQQAGGTTRNADFELNVYRDQ